MADEKEDSVQKGQSVYRSWISQINDALKREKGFRLNAERCVKIYEARKPEENPFAILYSNTETLAPAVYNARPVPLVDRRFKDADPLGKVSAEVGTRILKYLIEAESADYDNFDELMQPAVLDVLVTNRGVTEFIYEADTSGGTVKNECVYGQAVRWDKFLHGYARTWKKVPWIGFEYDFTREEMEENFPKIDAKKFEFSNLSNDTGNDSTENSGETRQEQTGAKLAKVYKIWDKETRKVYFFSPVYKDGPLKVLDDPLKLVGFFPIPKPLNFMRKISTLIPTPLYIQYETQAKELNELTRRLKYIIKAVKVRGMYNSTIEGIEKVLDADDNTLIPAENMASMPDGASGMDKIIWLMPLNDLVSAAQSLYVQREQCKNVIYEITGISDILRGASVASETATAQNIKNQWGTLRLKKMQKEVQRYCRDCLRIMLEIAATKFSQPTVAGMTGLQYPTAEQKQQAQQQVQMIQQQAQMQAANQPPPQPGQPPTQAPQPPQVPPELTKLLQSPTWEDIMGVLSQDTVRSYKVDIETNSTIDAEAAQDKQDIAELLNALSQFLNGIGPLVQEGVLPQEIAKQMLLVIARRYTFGPQLEDAINQMQPPPPKEEDPADKIKLQVVQEQAKADTVKAQAEAASAQQEMQIKERLAALEMENAEAELGIKRQELDLQRQELGMKQSEMLMKHEFAKAQHSMKLQQMAAKAAEPKKETSVAAV